MTNTTLPNGGVLIGRDLTRWPRNSKPPTIDTSRLLGFTIHYAGGPLSSYGYGTNPVAADERLIGATIRAHNARPGLTDVGYNFLVGRSGQAYEGRGAMAMNGANGAILASIKSQYPPGTTTTNPFFVSVFLCAGTDTGFTDVTTSQEGTTLSLLRFLSGLYGIKSPIVNGHRDVRATACPGDPIWRRLAGWQASLGFVPSPTTCAVSVQAHPEWSCWPDNKSKPTIAVGSTGGAVSYLQGVLSDKANQSIVVDGSFGPQTLTAVDNLQHYFNRVRDGVVGPATWAIVDRLAKG